MSDEKNDLFPALEGFLKDNNLMNQQVFEDSLNKEKVDTPKEGDDPAEPKPIGFTLEELEAPAKDSIIETPEPKEDGSEDAPKEDEGSENGTSDIYSTISQMLKEDGVLDTEFKSAEEMIQTFSEAIKNGIESYKEELPEKVKELIEGYEEGVPFEDILKIKSEQIKWDSITDEVLEENVELQKNAQREYLKATTKFNDAKIEKEINRLIDLDELLDSSKESIEELKTIAKEKEIEKIEAAKKERIIQEENYRKTLNDLNDRVKKTTEIIPGIKLTEKEQKELFKAITTPVETRGNEMLNQVMLVREKDPIGFEMKLNYYIKLGLFDETPDISKIGKVAETKTVSKLEQQLQEAAKKTASRMGGSKVSSETEDIIGALKTTFKR